MRKPENEAFYTALENDSRLLSEADTQQFLFDPYFNKGKFSGTFGNHPEKG